MPRLLELVEMELRELLSSIPVPTAMTRQSFRVQPLRPSKATLHCTAKNYGADGCMSTATFLQPVREVDKPFLMPVEDVFTITGRGTVATGRIERGVINVNEPVEIIGMMKPDEKPITSTVTGVEMFRKLLDRR
jgi:elongation factor Tu